MGDGERVVFVEVARVRPKVKDVMLVLLGILAALTPTAVVGVAGKVKRSGCRLAHALKPAIWAF